MDIPFLGAAMGCRANDRCCRTDLGNCGKRRSPRRMPKQSGISSR